MFCRLNTADYVTIETLALLHTQLGMEARVGIGVKSGERQGYFALF
jgi:hypothetical protein